MKKKITIFLIISFLVISIFSAVYATNNTDTKVDKININSENKTNNSSENNTSDIDLLTEEGTSQLILARDKELKTLEDYQKDYGSQSYGTAAYILKKVATFSVPLVFVGIAVSAIYQYVIGIRKLDVRDKGFSTMIAIITIGVICQILPLVFAIVVKSGVS